MTIGYLDLGDSRNKGSAKCRWYTTSSEAQHGDEMFYSWVLFLFVFPFRLGLVPRPLHLAAI